MSLRNEKRKPRANTERKGTPEGGRGGVLKTPHILYLVRSMSHAYIWCTSQGNRATKRKIPVLRDDATKTEADVKNIVKPASRTGKQGKVLDRTPKI